MVREELLRRQLLAAEDRLLAAFKDGGLEEFLHQWASLQELIAAGAEQGQLSNELLLLNQSVCQDVADIVQSCLAVDEGIHEAFNAHDIHSDFTLSNEDQDVAISSDVLRSGVPTDDGVSTVPEKTSQHLESDYGKTFSPHESLSEWDEDNTQDRGHTSNFSTDIPAWLEAELEDDDDDDDEELDEPDPDWDIMQDWLLANIAFPFLDPNWPDPIIRSAPITPDHLETWVSEICKMCNWNEVYSRYALNDRSRMRRLCDLAFGPKSSKRSAGSSVISKKVKSAIRTMRKKAIAACNYLIHARAQLTVDLERMLNMLEKLPAGEEISDDVLDGWSEADWNAWEADIVNRYNQLSLSSSTPSLEGQEDNAMSPISCIVSQRSSPISMAHQQIDLLHPESACANANGVGEPLEVLRETITQELSLPHPVPVVPCPMTGIKRKLTEFLGQFDTLDAGPSSPPQVLQPKLLDQVIHPLLEDVSKDSHRSKRRRSYSPPVPLLDSIVRPPDLDLSAPETLSALSPVSPNASSPLSQSSPSSGSESGSPQCPSSPGDQHSPSETQHYPSPTYSIPSFSRPLSPKPNSSTPESRSLCAVDTGDVSATSPSITPTNRCLPVLPNNLTAYSSITHSLYTRHSTPKATPYSITTALFKSGSGETRELVTEQINTASAGMPNQVQITCSKSDQQDELPSKPPQERVMVERKRTRINFEVDLDCVQSKPTPWLPITTTYRRMRLSHRWSSRCDKSSKRAKKGDKDNLSPCRALLSSLDPLLHRPNAVPKRSLDFQRADLDKRDIRPIKRAYLAPRDYSLSPDT